MSTAATAGFAATLKYKLSGGSTFTALANVANLTPPSLEVGDIDVSNRDSPKFNTTVPVKEYIPGWMESGQIEVTVVFNGTEYETVMGMLGTPGSTYQIDFGDKTGAMAANSTLTIPGYLKGLSPDTPLENGAETFRATFKLTGVPVFAKAA